MSEDSETFRTLVEARKLIESSKTEAGVEMVREMLQLGLQTAERLIRESEERHMSRQGTTSNPEIDQMNRLSNLRSLTDLGERLYPNEDPIKRLAKVKEMLKP